MAGAAKSDAIDQLVTEDFVIRSAGHEIKSRSAFKQWVLDFQSKVTDLDFESLVGTAIWAVREDGLLEQNWVERNAWEVYRQLTGSS